MPHEHFFEPRRLMPALVSGLAQQLFFRQFVEYEQSVGHLGIEAQHTVFAEQMLGLGNSTDALPSHNYIDSCHSPLPEPTAIQFFRPTFDFIRRSQTENGYGFQGNIEHADRFYHSHHSRIVCPNPPHQPNGCDPRPESIEGT